MPKCHFQDEWLKKFPWIQSVPNQSDKAYCKLCVNTFSLSNMGLTAVNSHRKGKKHVRKENAANSSPIVGEFFEAIKSKDSLPTAEPVSNAQAILAAAQHTIVDEQPKIKIHSTSTLNRFVIKENSTRAEIMWCVQTILTHKSLRSAAKDVQLFPSMFPDSDIAKSLQLSRTKMAYIIVYGLSPFFEQMLLDEVTALEHVVIGFDECLNKITQKQQMDLNVRYWDLEQNLVKTRYLTSVFLGRSCASDLLEAFLSVVKLFKLKSLLQISMDAPNTNIKFFKELQKCTTENPEDPEILTIGSCGLHALNVSFKTGAKASGWSIIDFFRSLYYVFKDSPARRAWYISLTECPQKFCSVRWLENSSVASRALEMLPHLLKFIEGLEKEKAEPNTKTYYALKEALEDKLLAAKICFFQIIAREFEGFLKEYQTDIPMIPFLYSDLSMLIKGLMERFIQKKVLKNESDVLAVDIENPENLLPAKNIDIGIATNSMIKKSKATDDDFLIFRKECMKFLINCVLKLQERSPLNYALTKAVSCFDPMVAINEGIFSKRLNKLLLIFIEKKWITSLEAESIKKQLRDIMRRPIVVEKCKSYKRYGLEKERIDNFWFELLKSENFQEAQKVLKLVMILPHGNSNIERGFSINSDRLWNNMTEYSLVARRRMYDYVTVKGGLPKFQITQQMIQHVKNARINYSEAQEAKRRKNKDREAILKRRRDATAQIKELESKKAKILKEAEKESLLLEEEIDAIRKNKITK